MAPLAAALSLRTMTICSGVGTHPQIRGLRAGVDVLVACPGRLRDHISEGHASLDAVEVTALDEADHMANLGFLPTVRWLMEKPPTRSQRLLFSATLDAAVDVLVRRFLVDAVTLVVQADPPAANGTWETRSANSGQSTMDLGSPVRPPGASRGRGRAAPRSTPTLSSARCRRRRRATVDRPSCPRGPCPARG
jgi:DEAD/DEAH box helicase